MEQFILSFFVLVLLKRDESNVSCYHFTITIQLLNSPRKLELGQFFLDFNQQKNFSFIQSQLSAQNTCTREDRWDVHRKLYKGSSYFISGIKSFTNVSINIHWWGFLMFTVKISSVKVELSIINLIRYLPHIRKCY